MLVSDYWLFPATCSPPPQPTTTLGSVTEDMWGEQMNPPLAQRRSLRHLFPATAFPPSQSQQAVVTQDMLDSWRNLPDHRPRRGFLRTGYRETDPAVLLLPESVFLAGYMVETVPASDPQYSPIGVVTY